MDLRDYPLIITVNQRLARALLDQFAADKQAQGLRVWETPQIIPWSRWTTECWRADLNLTSSHMLISPRQTQLVWEDVIRKAQSETPLLNPQQTSRLAVEAWKVEHEWDINLHLPSALLSLDQKTYSTWRETFIEILDSRGWITQEQVTNAVIRLAESATLPLSAKSGERILWAGFDLFTPQQQRLRSALDRNGFVQTELEPTASSRQACRVAVENSEAEIQFAAAYCRDRLHEDPGQSIAVVLPDLTAQRAEIARIFDQTLGPQNASYSFSMGEPLADQPVIVVAFQLIKLALQGLEQAEFSHCLRSPFLGEAIEERLIRSRFDAKCREWSLHKIRLQQCIDLMQQAQANHDGSSTSKTASWYAPSLLARCEAMQTVCAELPSGKQALNQWWRFFQRILDAAGWPGERVVNSEEFQACTRWNEAGMAWLSDQIVLGEITVAQALTRLQAFMQDQDFKAESAKTPVQVLGVLEAGGLSFDHLLVLGLSDDAWPAKVMRNPFLPARQLEDKAMPLASANGALQLASQITQRFAHAAQHVIFSWPQQNDDQHLRVSALIAPFPLVTSDALITTQLEPPQTTEALEMYVDQQGQKLEGDLIDAPGGASLLKDQAACAFRAFARYRLRARGLQDVEPALNAAERGSLIHLILENLWGQVQSQANWLATSETQQTAMIEAAVRSAMQDIQSQTDAMQLQGYREIEALRLQQAVASWMQIETSRSSFVVKERETAEKVQLSHLLLNTRIDRIDELEDGSLALMDYKTGEVKASDWESDRPAEPQLPLYAISREQTPKTILFASLKRGAQKLVGITALENEKSRQIKHCDDWDAQLADWERVLSNLADAFYQGDARVNPENAATCAYCDLHAFCRIAELNEQAGTLSDDILENGHV